MIDVLIVGPSWSAKQDPVTEELADSLDRTRFVPRKVLYPGSGIANRLPLAERVRNSANPVVIAGYAQGAAIAGNVAADIGESWDPNPPIVACALISDPLRPSGRFLGRNPGGYGILGERGIRRIPTYWASAPGDLTTALPADSPLRMIPEIFDYLDLSSEEDMFQFGRKLIDASIRDQLRAYPFAQRMWRGRGAELNRVSRNLFTAPYVEDYVRQGYATVLAETLNNKAFVRD